MLFSLSEQLKGCFSTRRIRYFYTILSCGWTRVHSRFYRLSMQKIGLSRLSCVPRFRGLLSSMRLPSNSFIRVGHLFWWWVSRCRILLMSAIRFLFFSSIAFFEWWLLRTLATPLVHISLVQCSLVTTWLSQFVWRSYFCFGAWRLRWVIFSAENVERSFASRRVWNFNMSYLRLRSVA